MIRAHKIAAVSDMRLPRAETENLSCGFCLLCSVFVILGLTGCTEPEEEPIWKDIKIGDLAPSDGGKPLPSQLIETINFDLHIFEMPADNIDKLDDIRKTLHTKSLRFNSTHAFGANSFSARFGQIRIWNETYSMLLAAGAKQIAKVSLMLAEGLPETIAVTGFGGVRTVFFTSVYGSRDTANVGPGILALRIKAQKDPALRGVCNVIAYPVFSPPLRKSAIPQLDARAKVREFHFSSAAFGLKMGPGDFVLLGPKEYISDLTDLGGLFFSNPQGSFFFSESERKPLERKPAVRIFLLMCTRIND
jgi:hypothetical protein